MRHADGDDIELIDLDAPQTPPPPAVAGAPIGRRFVSAVVVVSTVLVLGAVTWLVLTHRTRHETRVVVPPGVAGIDAAGCPANSTCVPVSVQFNALYLAVARLFDQNSIVYSVGVHNGAGANAYRSAVVLRLPNGVQIVAVAGCVPHGRAVPARTPSLPAVGPVQAVIITPGRTGCSSSVSLTAPRGASVPREQIRQLAADRRIYG